MTTSSPLSSSPTSSMAPPELLSPRISKRNKQPISLEEFVEELPQTIHDVAQKSGVSHFGESPEMKTPEPKEDPIAELFGRLVLERHEWERYALFEPSKNYTRNLIATDGETFTLLLLCWNPGRESPIHDHPCDGCWMRLCEGKVQECRYVRDSDEDRLVCVSDNVFQERESVCYITDSLGYHKVGNPSATVPAVTMHLYCPPFQSCKIWLDPEHASQPMKSCVCYHSEYGRCI